MRFVPICCAEDLDVHADPPAGWQRVAVVGGWTTAAVLRKRWPNAAVVGPLRSLRGIDWLLRNLLANPQIRALVWDGPDHSDNKEVLTLIGDLWILQPDATARAAIEKLAPDLREVAPLVTAMAVPFHLQIGRVHEAPAFPDEDRPGGAIVLPPPPPPAVDILPHGDPGQRVVGDTLADVWPRALEQAMRFGRIVPTQYGETREVCDLVSVIRDPIATLAAFTSGNYAERYLKTAIAQGQGRSMDEMEPGSEGRSEAAMLALVPPVHHHENVHPLLGMTRSSVDAYYRQLVGLDPPNDRDAYGKRMRGGYANGDRPDDEFLWGSFECSACPCGMGCFQAVIPREGEGHCLRCCPRGHELPEEALRSWDPCSRSGYSEALNPPDQIAAIEKLLGEAPLTRAALLTPWRAGDAGRESGRPCLVGARFRATPERPVEGTKLHAIERWKAPENWPGGNLDAEGRTLATVRLHLTLHFRSHDLFGGYPRNLAAALLWLVNMAEAQGMAIGTLTCVSGSAHVYARDWSAALDVVKAHPAPVVDLDRRSNWRVFTRPGENPIEATCSAWVREPGGMYAGHGPGGVLCSLPATAAFGRADGRTNGDPFLRCEAHALDRPMYVGDTAMHPRLSLPRKLVLVAEAIDPTDPNRVLAEYTSETGPGPLALAVVRSGLVTSIGGAIYLGQELERVWAKARALTERGV